MHFLIIAIYAILISIHRVAASCTVASGLAYDQAVLQGDATKAFAIIAQEIPMTQEERGHFKIIPGYSGSHDDRHGQADPDSLNINLDPDLFNEGESGACQGIEHELTHLRQFRRDRSALYAHLRSATSEEDAYDSLEDNDLTTHDASMEIEAVLSQIPFAPGGILRDDDFSYLMDQLKRWADSQSMIIQHANEAFYLPGIKKEDTRWFCAGVAFAQKKGADTLFINGALSLCPLQN